MAVNPDVGRSYGYSPNQWANMSSEERARIKAMNTPKPSSSAGSSTQGSYNSPQYQYQGFAPEIPEGNYMAAPAPAADVGGDMGGDMGGSDYGGYVAAPAPTRRLDTAPEWLAYLSALGLEESMARADVDRMRGLYQSEAARLKQDLVPQYQQQRRGIAGSLETRGMARSGEYLRRLAENRAAQGRQQAGIEANLAGQVGQLESQLAQRMGSLASQRAQQELSLRSQGYV